MTVRSPWRQQLYQNLAKISLSGSVIDLGGSRKSKYLSDFDGDFELTVANLEGEGTQDIFVDLEKPFSLKDSTYDHVLCINVLEHIFNYQNVISESYRILKPGGSAVFAIPFLIQVHPSPNDHWRFTGQTLERLFNEAGFSEVQVEAIGTGVFGSIAQIKSNILHFPILRKMENLVAKTLDKVIGKLLKNSTYNKEFYPLGYVIKVKK